MSLCDSHFSCDFSVPMVLVKIKCQIQGEDIPVKKILGSNVDFLGREDSDQDLNDIELAGAGCELALVEDQFCIIPYELYDLQDLTEILSSETWNSCLTEEERFYLSGFLPDMDQQTFWLTMNELLSGKDMFFGSPLTVLFERMKGGFYPPKVTSFREGLQFLQKRTFYHSLRLYHENMARTFSDMKKAWSKCRSSSSVEERVHIWNNCKNHRNMTVVDLNELPEDEDLLEKNTVRMITEPMLEMVKFSPAMASAPLKTNGKGVLKIKPKSAAMHPVQAGMVCRPTPKGVLKVIQRGPLSQIHEPRMIPGRQEFPASAEHLGFQTSRLSALPQLTCRWDAETFCEELPFLHQPDRSGSAYKSLEPPDCVIGRQRVEHLNSTTGPSGNFHRSIRKKKRAKDATFVGLTDVQEVNLIPKHSLTVKKYSRRSSQIREPLSGEDLCQYKDQQKREYYHHSKGQQVALMHDNQILLQPRTSDMVLRISGIGTGKQQMLVASLDQSKEVYEDVKGGIEHLYDEPVVSRGLRDGPTPPITYKRRKALSKVNTLDIPNPQAGGVKLV